MKVFRTSLFVADEEIRSIDVAADSDVPITLYGRRDVKTSGKLSYGPKVGRPINVTSECDVLLTTLAEWVEMCYFYFIQ